MGRHPNRTGRITAQSRGNDPCRDRRSRSPARPARNARKVVRVLHVAEGRIGARAPQGELVHIGFREQNCALLEQHVGERRVGLRTIILEERRARGRRKARRIDIVLKYHRQAGKWP
jgi:hypothetical protein